MGAAAVGSIGGGCLTKILVVLQFFLTINIDCIVGDPDPLDIHVNVHVDFNIAKPKESSIGKYLDDLETYELWLHILHQFDRPYGNRSIYRGDKNYVYYLDNEIIIPDEYASPIIIPYIEDFTANIQRFTKLLNYPTGNNELPSWFEPDVKEAANELYKVYLENPGAKGILKVAANAKDYVNEYIHIHTLKHALIYDNYVNGYTLPAFSDVFPEFFSSNCTKNTGNDCCKIDEYPHDLTGDEWKISYWREDSAFNEFHGSWHFYNPFYLNDIGINHGELFYYFHNQLVARYDWERLSNGLPLVKSLDNWNSQIPQNYFPPVLTNTLKRCQNQPSKPLDALSIYRNNFEQDIPEKALKKYAGGTVPIDTDDGIKLLGCTVERAGCGGIAPEISNITYNASGIHNQGHIISSEMNCDPIQPAIDPKMKGVMYYERAAVRDPIFFRWHKFIDDLFQLQKKILPEYKVHKLVMEGISVSNVDVYSRGDFPKGQLHTFNSKRKLTLWRNATDTDCIYQPHTNHYPFTYELSIDSNNSAAVDVNVRIYMAPKLNSTNDTLNYNGQRTLWGLVDRFKKTIPPGCSLISRGSCDSTITTPPSELLQELRQIYGNADYFNEHISKPKKCQCGLPEHLLIPRGNAEGMPFQLFVYITPYVGSQSRPSDCENLECGDLCSKDYTRCLHSDGEPMGFPFDRPLTTIDTIEDLDKMLPNAMLHNIKIFYNKNVHNSTRQCSN